MRNGWTVSAPDPPGGTPGGSVEQAWFTYEARYWTVIYNGTVCRLKDSKGLHYLAVLLSRPGERVAAVDLVAARVHDRGQRGPSDPAGAERARLNVIRAIGSALRRLKVHHPALWNHLAHTLRTGKYCTYTPDARLPIQWNR